MIVSFSRNYIYFRPKKTGSSTIEAVLRRHLAPDDIIGGRKVSDLGKENGTSPERQTDDHPKAIEIKRMVTEEFWHGSYKFASVRHPYEKAVSMAYYKLSKVRRDSEGDNIEFLRLLDEVVQGHSYCGSKFYCIRGESVVDDFIRHEHFEEDLRRVGARIGVPIPDKLPRHKGNIRLDRRPAREILSPEQQRIVFETCRKEFLTLGYEP